MSAVYEMRDGGLYATELSRGPWDPGAQHGGAPAAILMREFERCDGTDAGGGELPIARVTYELLRPVPLGPLHASAAIVRPGRRVQLLEGSLFAPDGTEVIRARALRVARAPVSAGAGAGVDPPPPGPSGGRENDFPDRGIPLFPRDAMEVRFVRGRFMGMGPATAWFRLRVPLLEGEDPTPRQRLAAAADFPNGIATELPWDDWVFINPDLTIHIDRDPVGEWICLDAKMRVSHGGLGQAEAVLYDSEGRVGRSLQSLYVAPRA